LKCLTPSHPTSLSRITPCLHPEKNEVIPRVDEWFLHHWLFLNEAVCEEFKFSDLALFTCYVAPDALDVHSLSMVDALEKLSIEEAQGSYRKFVGLILGHEDVHPSTQAEKVIHDLHTEARRIGELVCEYRFLDARYGLTISVLRFALDIQRPQKKDEVISECEHLVGYYFT
ncbi:hypothetical protein M422DRAFT_37656, partial [Sphaerobolus stellatus SS14]